MDDFQALRQSASAIHVTPEALRWRLTGKSATAHHSREWVTGELIPAGRRGGTCRRQPHIPDPARRASGTGRELFGALREKLSVRSRAQPVSILR